MLLTLIQSTSKRKSVAGDVVTAYSVQNPKHVVCKRVLGLEGDTIKVPWSSTNGPARTVKVVCSFLALPCMVDILPSIHADHDRILYEGQLQGINGLMESVG